MSEPTPVPAAVTGAVYAGMLLSASNALHRQKDLINRLNVYPVPDGDTGSNMSMTVRPASELSGWDGPLSACAEKAASLFLRAARGNSGVILSLFFRGVAHGFRGLEQAGVPELLAAFGHGVEEAYKAVQYPREGTILTVMRCCAEVDGTGCDLLTLFNKLCATAEETLEKTPEMLPVLKQAGVVDSGGRGFLEILNGMRLALCGRPVESAGETDGDAGANFSAFATEDIQNPYCTECIVTKSDAFRTEGSAETFRRFVLAAGDSVVFAEDAEIIKIHVHTKDPGRVLSEALKYGSLYTVKVENMRNQHTELLREQSPASAPPEEPYGFVAVTMGDGMKAAFEDFGVSHFVHGGQTMNPSTEQLVEAVRATPAKTVYLFPNNANVCLVAEQACELVQDRSVVVIPSVSVPQGLSALLRFDPEQSPEVNTEAMTDALSTVRTLDVTFAAHDSTVNGEAVREGQILGLVDHKVRVVADSRPDCLRKLASEIGDASFLTVFYGEEVSAEEADEALALLCAKLPEAEISMLPGGQPLYFYVISAE